MSPEERFESVRWLALRLTSKFIGLNPLLQRERDDLVTEALLAAWRAALSFEPARGAALSTYAYRCIWNALRNHAIRDQQREAHFAVSLDAPVGEDEVDCLGDLLEDPRQAGTVIEEQANLRLLLRREIAKLTPLDQALVLALFYREEREAELARRLGTSHASISRRRRRVLCTLRQQLLHAGFEQEQEQGNAI